MASKKEQKRKNEKNRTARGRRDMQLRGARGTRLLPVRILSTVALCIDVYWLLWMGATKQGITLPGILPLACIVADVLGVYEQARMMTYGVKDPKLTEIGTRAGLVLYFVAFGITMIAGKDVLFFYYSDAIFAYVNLLVGAAVRLVLEYRLHLIETNTDKQYELYRRVVDGKYKF